MRPTLPCPGAGLAVLPGNPALGALREFRERLLGCLTAWGDALLELADAVLCSDRPVRWLVQLSLEPEFRRGHGALYDALAAGRVDDEGLFSLLTEVLPPLVDGPEARAWTAGHDVIDRRMLDGALSGVPAADAARVRGAYARWRRVRVAVDATSYPRPDAWCGSNQRPLACKDCHHHSPAPLHPPSSRSAVAEASTSENVIAKALGVILERRLGAVSSHAVCVSCNAHIFRICARYWRRP